MQCNLLLQVLTPRVKAFDTALKSLQNYVDAVYDITVIYDDKDQCTASKNFSAMLLIIYFICLKKLPIFLG